MVCVCVCVSCLVLQLYLVGSMREPKGHSLSALTPVLAALHQHTDKVLRVRLACVWDANTDPDTGAPRTHGLWMRLSPGMWTHIHTHTHTA